MFYGLDQTHFCFFNSIKKVWASLLRYDSPTSPSFPGPPLLTCQTFRQRLQTDLTPSLTHPLFSCAWDFLDDSGPRGLYPFRVPVKDGVLGVRGVKVPSERLRY